MTVPSTGPGPQPAPPSTKRARSWPEPMEEVDAFRVKLFPEDPAASSTAELINLEDGHYTALRAELEADALDLQAESWSVCVEQSYLKGLSKEAIKRQDVIYELIQTEMHHVRTLKILFHVYMYEMKESLQLAEARLERLFPRVDHLLMLHQHFLNCLKLRRQEALEQDGLGNYQIHLLGDLLITQFSGELGEKMKETYSVFCSHHSDALNLHRETQQSNKKLQNLVKKIGQLSITRRLGISECFLLVTQRITKYPVLVERLIQNTPVDSEDHQALLQALALIKDTLCQVDAQVSEYEKASRLRDIAQRLESKSQGRLKDGRLFRREDLLQGARVLLHEAPVTWKASSGRLKEIHAVLLSDMLLLLQEKDQKLVFATVDNKPPVISLQRMIVREVAHEDKAMFLICASSTLPEMYEIHNISKQARDTWMALIREAVDRCPEGGEELYGEKEARTARRRDFQDRLMEKDAQIIHSLTEKLQIFAAFAQVAPGQETPNSRLLLRGDATDLQQGEFLLKGAITEVENLQNILLTRMRDFNSAISENQLQAGHLRRAETFGGFDSNPSAGTMKNGVVGDGLVDGDNRPLDSGQRASSDPELQDLDLSGTLELSADGDFSVPDLNSTSSDAFPDVDLFDGLLMLSQRLYTLQAIIAQQDSQLELQRASLLERDRASRQRGGVLLEQEKQRNLEKHREEMANFQKLQAQRLQEQQRWEKDRERQRLQTESLAAQLVQREEECRRLEERLAEDRAELERQREAYQQDLERLREATQSVEKEKERLEKQMKYKKHKTISNPGHFQHEDIAKVSYSQSLRVDGKGPALGDLLLSPKAHLQPSPPTTTSTDPAEVPPTVPPRRESISPQPVKAEIPIHLISTTNQAHKPVVQQQIPTKLAALSKGKEKSSKHKASHHRTHSAASIDMSQVVPIRVTGKEGGSLRAKRTASPQRVLHSDRFSPPGALPPNVKPSQSFSAYTRSSDGPPPEPPPFPKEVLKPDKERVIFL